MWRHDVGSHLISLRARSSNWEPNGQIESHDRKYFPDGYHPLWEAIAACLRVEYVGFCNTSERRCRFIVFKARPTVLPSLVEMAVVPDALQRRPVVIRDFCCRPMPQPANCVAYSPSSLAS